MVVKTLIGTLFRLFPLETEPGLRVFGNPDENSPVFVTSNFDLTVKRVSKHLKNLDCYLLVAPTKGINVWCSAVGGFFNAHSVISAIKISRIEEKVKHRTLILPQLSAPGVNTRTVERETGWKCKFGPVYAKDIPEYVRNGFKKTEKMRRVKFDLIDRLDAGIGSTFFFYMLIGIFLLIFKRSWFKEVALLGGLLLIFMYAVYPYVPGRSGYVKLLSFEGLIAMALFVYLWAGGVNYGIFLTAMIIAGLIGIDFGGVSPIYRSDLDPLLDRLGIRKIGGVVFEGRSVIRKQITLDRNQCIGCGMCFEVCPKGVYTIEGHKANMVRPEECVVCRACVMQCPVKALSL